MARIAHGYVNKVALMSKCQYEVIFYPGKTLTQTQQAKLVLELREVASACFVDTPDYQALSGQSSELEKAVICLGRDEKGRLLGFCSALSLPVDGHKNVLHLGLTCVHPDARGTNMTHHLTSKLMVKYLVKESFLSELWITNCACVLSSLGNVAMYFENLYPSPYGVKKPSAKHIDIAKSVDAYHRESIAINKSAEFNTEKFVFEGSVDGTVFEKNANDQRFHHRDENLTGFYQELLNFERGDEALQIGKVSLMTYPKYVARKAMARMKASLPSRKPMTA